MTETYPTRSARAPVRRSLQRLPVGGRQAVADGGRRRRRGADCSTTLGRSRRRSGRPGFRCSSCRTTGPSRGISRAGGIRRRIRSAPPRCSRLPGEPGEASGTRTFAPRPGDVVVTEHWGSSGFAMPDLDFSLKQAGATRLILVGLLANTCIEGTARFAAELGYHVTLVTDATAAASPERMHAAHVLNGPTFAHRILTTAELMDALPPASGVEREPGDGQGERDGRDSSASSKQDVPLGVPIDHVDIAEWLFTLRDDEDYAQRAREPTSRPGRPYPRRQAHVDQRGEPRRHAPRPALRGGELLAHALPRGLGHRRVHANGTRALPGDLGGDRVATRRVDVHLHQPCRGLHDRRANEAPPAPRCLAAQASAAAQRTLDEHNAEEAPPLRAQHRREARAGAWTAAGERSVAR